MVSTQRRWIVRSALLCLLVTTCFAQFAQRQTVFSPRGSNRYQADGGFSQQGSYQQQQGGFQQNSLHQQTRNFNQQQQGGFQQNSLHQQTRNLDQQQNGFNGFQQRQPSAQAGGAACPEPNGRFPVASQCDAYIECIDGVGEQKLCPEGLLFNPEARFNYPCGYPIDVQCLGRSSLQPAQPTEECPHQYGYFKMGDSRNCGKFMNCVEGRSYVFDCPEGLAYNSETYRCDWPDQVPDCDAEAFLGFTCPSSGQSTFLNSDSETRLYRSPNDCQHYYICVNNRPRLQNCGEGHAFNELIGTCDAAENVTGCEPPHSANRNFQPVQLDQPQQNFGSFNQQNFGSFDQQQNLRRNQNQYSRQRFSSF